MLPLATIVCALLSPRLPQPLPSLTRGGCAPVLRLSEDPEAAPVEARVTIRDAGVKGKGAFAMEPLRAGTWVSRYVGDLLDDVAIKERYEDPSAAAYLLELNDDLCLDAQNSSHFSRYFNHAEFGNLETRFSDVDPHRIDFFASRDIDAGEELTFD